MGVTPESLGETGIQRLLNGHESAVLDIRISFEGIDFETPACIRLVESAGGKTGPERGMLQAVSRTGPAVHGYGAFSRSERESFQGATMPVVSLSWNLPEECVNRVCSRSIPKPTACTMFRSVKSPYRRK
ncbi:DUF4099 domain-containing protein [Bacteroides ovatus]|nr:DUF4099 domain-containing protein [Bacteroides ovatus]